MSTKKVVLFFLIAIVLCSFNLVKAALPEMHQGDYFYIVLEDGGVEITKYTGKAKALKIPDSLGGFQVTSIGNKAFAFCDSLTTISIPDSVTSIGDDAFHWCNFRSIMIPDSIISIGSNPFQGCNYLTSINISSNHPTLAVVDGVLFSKRDKRLICYPVTKKDMTYHIPEGIQSIGDYAFAASGLTSIVIPDSVSYIGNYAFRSCTNLEKIIIPDSVRTIREGTFYGCSWLSEINIPDGVTSIEKEAFAWCMSISQINIPASVTSIGKDVFYWCDMIVIGVVEDSYAESYCIDNGLNYHYEYSTSNLDWLNN